MTQEKFNELVKIEENDKFYLFKLHKGAERLNLQRLNSGFNLFELLGILKLIENDLLKQLEGNAEPGIDITKQVEPLKKEVIK